MKKKEPSRETSQRRAQQCWASSPSLFGSRAHPSLNDITCIVTGSTSGIGQEIARQLEENGAHVIMAVRNPKAAHELIRKWQDEGSGIGLPLNIEVMKVDLLSLNSVAEFAEEWNARATPLHVLINNAGIYSIGGFNVETVEYKNISFTVWDVGSRQDELWLGVKCHSNPELTGSPRNALRRSS